MWEIKVVLGYFGHSRRKPTTLGTNMPLLHVIPEEFPDWMKFSMMRGMACGLQVVKAILDKIRDPMVKKL